MNAVIGTVVSIFSQPADEPLLARMHRESLEAILAENHAHCAACVAARESYEATVERIKTTPIYSASPEFLARRAEAERQAGTTFRKFFGA